MGIGVGVGFLATSLLREWNLWKDFQILALSTVKKELNNVLVKKKKKD